jgi:DHA1 family multidrug resistance protein-like MFS transporter
MRLKIDIHLNTSELKVNRVIKYFVLSDLFFWGGWGLINPIFALFIVDRIGGATAVTVGIATALYWLVKAIAQVPIALYLDRRDRDHFDLHFLIIGLMFAGFIAMLFPLISNVGLLYLLMTFQGLAYGIYTPSWSAVFSRHLDKSHYAFDWSLDSTTVGIASGLAALIGGTIAGVFGFDAVFVLTGFFSFASGLLLLAVPDLVMPKETVNLPPILPDVMKQ